MMSGVTPIDTIRAIAADSDRVHLGGDCVFSMGGIPVYVEGVCNALANGTSCREVPPFLYVCGPTLDGRSIIVICKLWDGGIYVENVAPA